jgi:predicted GIY-YIG superfamily endonuclease
MDKYDNSVIYMIKCKDENIKDCYVGSTTNFKKRKRQHKCSCNNPNDKGYNYKVYKFIREHGGFDNWDFEIIVQQKCNDKQELYKIERWFIELYETTLNQSVPGKFIREDHKQYNKQYRKDNKEELNEKRKIKITCECGSTVRKYDIMRHKKSIKHINYYKKLSIVL